MMMKGNSRSSDDVFDREKRRRWIGKGKKW